MTIPTWHGALCREADPEVWFPAKGQAPTAARAKAICRQCPARRECLDYALREKITCGIWGGFTGRERRQLERTVVQ